jgi:hypothetical protein
VNWFDRLQESENGKEVEPTKPAKGASVGFVGDTTATAKDSSTVAFVYARLANFRELPKEEADAVLMRLIARDESSDERRMCIECMHLAGWRKARRCATPLAGALGGPAIPSDMVTVLMRCKGFLPAAVQKTREVAM